MVTFTDQFFVRQDRALRSPIGMGEVVGGSFITRGRPSSKFKPILLIQRAYGTTASSTRLVKYLMLLLLLKVLMLVLRITVRNHVMCVSEPNKLVVNFMKVMVILVSYLLSYIVIYEVLIEPRRFVVLTIS